jgi:hypothetical protein
VADAALQFPGTARLSSAGASSTTLDPQFKPPTSGTIDYFDDLTPGLSLRVTANDIRTWTVFYRDKNAQQKWLTLGRYRAVK